MAQPKSQCATDGPIEIRRCDFDPLETRKKLDSSFLILLACGALNDFEPDNGAQSEWLLLCLQPRDGRRMVSKDVNDDGRVEEPDHLRRRSTRRCRRFSSTQSAPSELPDQPPVRPARTISAPVIGLAFNAWSRSSELQPGSIGISIVIRASPGGSPGGRSISSPPSSVIRPFNRSVVIEPFYSISSPCTPAQASSSDLPFPTRAMGAKGSKDGPHSLGRQRPGNAITAPAPPRPPATPPPHPIHSVLRGTAGSPPAARKPTEGRCA